MTKNDIKKWLFTKDNFLHFLGGFAIVWAAWAVRHFVPALDWFVHFGFALSVVVGFVREMVQHWESKNFIWTRHRIAEALSWGGGGLFRYVIWLIWCI